MELNNIFWNLYSKGGGANFQKYNQQKNEKWSKVRNQIWSQV